MYSSRASPADSANSNFSPLSSDSSGFFSNPESDISDLDDFQEIGPRAYRHVIPPQCSQISTSFAFFLRCYLEDVLKRRNLRKSLYFLERLQTTVLTESRLALEKPADGADGDEGDGWELKRYGGCSREARDLNLPSYEASFLFLARVPLDVVHEFLRMRLEQKPEQPSLLSARQMMRELREGIKIASSHRQLYVLNSSAILGSSKATRDLEAFDDSLKTVLHLYLEYLGHWVAMVQHESFHKNLIMDEWLFVSSVASGIIDGFGVSAISFW